MELDELAEALWRGHVSALGGMGAIVAVALILALRVLLPRTERSYIRTPLVFLVLYLVFTAVATVAKGTIAERICDLLAGFSLLVSAGRSAVLLFMHSFFMRRVARPIPKIVRDLVQGLVYIFAAFVTLQAAGVEPGSLLTTSALLTAVIGLSLQDTLGNLFAGLAIQAQRPFEVGDWIQFDQEREHIGHVVEINWRATTVHTIQRVEITVPNAILAKTPIRNYTRPQRSARREVYVTAPYHVSPRTVQRLLTRAVIDVAGVLREPSPSVVTFDFDERGVRYQVRYFVDNFMERDVIGGRVRTRLWYALHRANIYIPVPHRTVHLHEVHADQADREREARVGTRERALRHVDFLSELPETACRRLAELSSTRLFAPEEVIVREGDEGDEFYIVEWGEVQVTVDDGHGSTIDLARLGPNSFFGEMSVMTGERRKATVQALRETELLVVDRRAFQEVLEAAPELAERVSATLATRQVELGERVARATERPKASDSERTNAMLDRIKEFFSL